MGMRREQPHWNKVEMVGQMREREEREVSRNVRGGIIMLLLLLLVGRQLFSSIFLLLLSLFSLLLIGFILLLLFFLLLLFPLLLRVCASGCLLDVPIKPAGPLDEDPTDEGQST